VCQCGASAAALESGTQLGGHSALLPLPAAALAGRAGQSPTSNLGRLVRAPSLAIPPEILRILILQLDFVTGKIWNWMSNQTFLEMKCVSSEIFKNIQ